MSQLQTQDLARTEIVNAINRCTAAYAKVRDPLPANASHAAQVENNQRALYALLDQLPMLIDPQSFQVYIACIAHGVVLGVIDVVDIGRYCHLAQTAMAAWKLANIAAPAAAQKEEKQDTPLPTKGNHPEDEVNHQAALRLPDRKTQNQLYKSLTRRGIAVPSDQDLRNNPAVALYFCDMAQDLLDELPPPDDETFIEPGQQHLERPARVS